LRKVTPGDWANVRVQCDCVECLKLAILWADIVSYSEKYVRKLLSDNLGRSIFMHGIQVGMKEAHSNGFDTVASQLVRRSPDIILI
jgi:hypothetical protein